MGSLEWAFLLEENIGRSVLKELAERGYHALLVIDVLEPGVADFSDILPYARENDFIIVTVVTA